MNSHMLAIRTKSFFFIVCIAIIFATCTFLFCTQNKKDKRSISSIPPKNHIIYVHGWEPETGYSYEEEVNLLKSIFPDSLIEVFEWGSNIDFDFCLEFSDTVADALASRIANYSNADREKITLVGHSLGGRIALKAMSSPLLQDKPIRCGIFLAAAIPHDAPEIAKAIKNTLFPNIIIYNRQDYVLRHLYSMFGDGSRNALGAFGYAYPFRHNRLLQYKVSIETPQIQSLEEYLTQMEKHFAVSYLRELSTIIDSYNNSIAVADDFWDHSTDLSSVEDVVVTQDRPNHPVKVILELGGETVDSFADWSLQRVMGNSYRIVDPFDYQRALGDEHIMRESFESIRKQINEKSGK